MSDKALADVSVVIPCYRCAETIARAVASISDQTLMPAEVILVDDCSGDGTLEALQLIQRDYPPGWIMVIPLAHNVGAGEARNAGWDAAKHDYIAFLDADDSWQPQKIEIQYQWMRAHPDVVLTGHACEQLPNNVPHQADATVNANAANFYAVSKTKLLLSNQFPTRSVMLKRSLAQRFAPSMRYCEDYLLWLEIACAGLVMCRSDLSLAYLYKSPYGESGLSAQLWKMEKGELEGYRTIYRNCQLGMVVYLTLISWSWLRFLRRLVFASRFGREALLR